MKTAKTINARILKGFEVFPAREIPHLWAHGLPTHSKIRSGGANNFFAIGDTIYSYSQYWPLARRHEHKNGEVAFLISSEKRVMPCQKHTYKTRRAVQNLGSVHEVSPQFWEKIAAGKHQDIATFYNTKIARLMAEIFSPRTRNIARAQILLEIDRIVDAWKSLHKAFRFRCDLACVTADISDIRDRVKKNCSTNNFTKKTEKEREKAFDKLAHWRKTGNMDGARMSDIPYPVLRLQGENLHTSYGAKIPITEARRLLELIPSILVRAEGRSTESIGGFGGVRVESDALNVGCHKIPWVEVRGFCDFVGWPIPENFPI